MSLSGSDIIELWVLFSKWDFAGSWIRGTSPSLMRTHCMVHPRLTSPVSYWHTVTVLSNSALGHSHVLQLPNEEHPLFWGFWFQSLSEWLYSSCWPIISFIVSSCMKSSVHVLQGCWNPLSSPALHMMQWASDGGGELKSPCREADNFLLSNGCKNSS